MKTTLSHIFIFICFIGVQKINAQDADVETDSFPKKDPTSYSIQSATYQYKSLQNYDSTFFGLHNYQIPARQRLLYQDLGDVLTPGKNLMYNPQTISGVNLGYRMYEPYLFQADQTVYYNASSPFTQFYYSQGKSNDRSMLNLEGLHTQNLGDKINLTLKYHSVTNEGFYLYQKNFFKAFRVATSYHNTKNNYRAFLSLNWNKSKFRENGGIASDAFTDSLFRELGGVVRLVNTGLTNASNNYRNRQHLFKHVLFAGFKDSAKKKGNPLMAISHTIRWNRESNYYSDLGEDQNFYGNRYYFNFDYSSDSVNYNSLQNDLEFILTGDSLGPHLNAGLSSQQFNVLQYADKGNYEKRFRENTSAFAGIGWLGIRASARVKANYFFSGFNRGDFLIESDIKQTFKLPFLDELSANVAMQKQQPSWLSERYLGNRYEWSRSWLPTTHQSAEFSALKGNNRNNIREAPYRNSKTEINTAVYLKLLQVNNAVYYDSSGLPKQINSVQQLMQLRIIKNFYLRHWLFSANLQIQSAEEQFKTKFGLPDYGGYVRLQYQTYLFKKALFIQTGFDMYYVDEYFANSYNPATRQFQEQNRIKIGNYPFVDWYLNGEIKTVRFFLKFEHLNMDIPSNTAYPNYFYISPLQPSATRRFRIGLQWKFYY